MGENGNYQYENEKKFIDGLRIKRNDKAPEFIICSIAVKEDTFLDFCAMNCNGQGWMNIEVAKSRAGKYYAYLNTWNPDNQSGSTNPQDDVAVAELVAEDTKEVAVAEGVATKDASDIPF